MKQYILIISHMRSYSTLLSHILGSHPEISGYAECHQSYKRMSDFQLLEEKITSHYDAELHGRYLLDKMLHNYIKISKSVLRSEQVRVIFLLREPLPTIQSILKMSELPDQPYKYSVPEKVSNYYINRIKTIQNFARKTPYKAAYIESNRIIHDSDVLLNGLTDWLELKSPLKQDYKIFKLTGIPGKGDPTSMIKKGRIEKIPGDRNEYPVPEKLIEKAQKDYLKVKLYLQNMDALG